MYIYIYYINIFPKLLAIPWHKRENLQKPNIENIQSCLFIPEKILDDKLFF